MRELIKFLVLPPVALYIGMTVGLVLAWRKQKWGLPLASLSLALLIFLSLPVVASALMRGAQVGVEPLSEHGLEASKAQAVVILSAGLDSQAPEAGNKPLVDAMTLSRLRYGAEISRKKDLPILVTGGPWGWQETVLAPIMAESLRRDFQLEPRWLETRAGNTAENATMSALMLEEKGITRIILVTHAWHMQRARRAFERAGFDVTPGPMGYEGMGPLKLSSFLPNASSLHDSYYAIHEHVGRVWYWLTG